MNTAFLILALLLFIFILYAPRENFDRYGLHYRKAAETMNRKNTKEFQNDLKYSKNWRESVYRDINKNNWKTSDTLIPLTLDYFPEPQEFNENEIVLAQTNKTGSKSAAY